MQSALWMRDHNLFPAEQWPLCSANGSIRFVQFIEDKKQLSRYAICHDTHWGISLTYFSSLTASQHQLHHLSIAFHCNGLGFMPAISLLMIVPHSVIGITIALSVALLGPQKTPSCLDGSSSSTHSNKHQPPWIFSLSTWMILESCNCCLCFFLPHFTMPHPACTAAIAKKITAAVFVAVTFSGTKAQWGCISGRGISAEAGQQRIQIDFCPFLSKPHLPHSTTSHWIWSTPPSQICWSHGRTGWEKHTIHKSVHFHELWHALICSVYLWVHKLKILSAGFLLCSIIRKT